MIFILQSDAMHLRHIASLIVDVLADTPVVLVNGARQSGKSTLVRSLTDRSAAVRQYLTLDDGVVLAAAKSDPAGFIDALQGDVTLDEVQRVPALFLAIKAYTFLLPATGVDKDFKDVVAKVALMPPA